MTSHLTASAAPPRFFALSAAAPSSRSSRATSAPAAANALAVAPPDGAAGAGDDGDLAGERLFRRGAELRLFERPILHVEHLGFGDRLEAADGLGIRDDLDRALRQVGGDACIFFRSAEAEQAEAGDERDPRQRIERLLDAADARILAGEVVVVVLDERLHRRVGGVLEIIRLAVLRARRPPAASSWCGWCDRASPPPPGCSGRCPRRRQNS